MGGWTGKKRPCETFGCRRKAWGKRENRSQGCRPRTFFSHSYIVFWTQYHEIVSSDLYPSIPIILITNRCGAYLAAGTDLILITTLQGGYNCSPYSTDNKRGLSKVTQLLNGIAGLEPGSVASVSQRAVPNRVICSPLGLGLQ